MFRFSKLVALLTGIREEETNFEMLVSQKWSIVDYWHGMRLYQKGNERIIYNPFGDEIVRRYNFCNDIQEKEVTETDSDLQSAPRDY